MKRIILLIALLIPQVAMAGFNGYLKADTEVIVTIGPFVDVGDGFTPQTDIALAGDAAELIKHGSTSVVDISGATWAAVTNCPGYYSLTLTTGYTDTEGQLTVIVHDNSDCLPVRNTFMVLNDNTYEAFFENAAEILTVNVTAVAADAIEAGDFKTGAIDADATAADFDAVIEAEAVDALESFELDNLLSVDTGVAADGDLENFVSSGSVMAHLMSTSADATLYKATTDSQEAIKVHADTIKAETVLIVADTGELQVDWADGGRLDLIQDIIAADTTTDIPGTITTLQTDVDKYDTDAEYATAIWNALTNAYGGAGTYGQASEDIVADTAAMDTAGEWDTLNATLITGVNVSSVDADAIEAGDFKTGAIDADAIAADFTTEILAVPFVDIAAGAPPYNASWFLGLNYIFEAYRNRFVTNTTGGVTEGRYYKNDGTTILTESNQSDDGAGTFDREELGAAD